MKAKTKQPKLSFNERVRKVLAGEAERKKKVVQIFQNSPIRGTGLDTAAAGGARGQYNINVLQTMAIAQGTEQEQREGNKISNCKLTVRGFVRSNGFSDTGAAGTNNSSYPFEVHMVWYKNKVNYSTSLNDYQNLKSLPNNQTGPIDGSIMNSLYPFNKDLYIIRRKRVFRLRPLPESTGSTDTMVNSQYSNAPQFLRFADTIDIHKDLKFNDGSNTPTNDWVGCVVYVVNGDGEDLATIQHRSNITMDAVLTYTDM